MQQPGGMMKGNADLEGVLSACLSPDNTLRQQAEAALKVRGAESRHIACCHHFPGKPGCLQKFRVGEVHGAVEKKPAATDQTPHAGTDGACVCQQGACKQPEVLHALLGRLKASHSPEVRLLAAQGIRRHAPKHWRRLSPQVGTLSSCYRPEAHTCWHMP